MKKLLKITVLVFLLLIGAAFALPYLFKDQIIAKVKSAINENIEAKVDFQDLDISLFRHFPRLSLGLESVYIKGLHQFSKDTLIAARKIDVAVNLMSAIRGGTIEVYSVNLDAPRIHAVIDESGKANWEITKPDTAAVTEEAGEPFSMKLRSYSIEDGYISYIDREGNMSMELVNLNHKGSGDFAADLFTLNTSSSADAVTFNYENVPYLLNTKAEIDAAIEVDAKNEKYSFKTDDISLNELKLSAAGFFQFLNDSTYNMDIAFNSPSNEFKSILSLVPAIYKNDFEKIKTSGSLVLNGAVKGKYSNTEIPAYHVNLDVKDGFFQYPELPKPVKNINLQIKIDNPDGITDHTVVDIPKGHIEMGDEPFDFRLLVKQPVSVQYVDAAVKGRFDLSQIPQYIKLEEGTNISGSLKADLQVKGNVTVITEKKAGPFSASGFLDITNLAYASKDLPQPIRNTNIKMEIQNPDGVPDHTVLNIPVAHVEIGNEPIDFRLMVKTPVSDLYFNGSAKGKFNLANVKEFVTLDPGTSLAGTLNADLNFSGRKSSIDKKDYQNINTEGSVELFDLNYVSKDYPDGVQVENLFANFNPRNVSINDVKGKFMHSNFQAEGSIDNLLGYALKDETLQGRMQFSADKVNLNEWMGAEDTASVEAEATDPFLVPANIAFAINAKVDKVIYDKTEITDLSGNLDLRNETVQMQQVTGNALGGIMTINGSYSTRYNKKKPDIAFTYDVKNIDIQKAFYAFNTFQKLMPAGQFLSGKLTSQMSVNGKLGETMMPDLTTLTGKGLFFVLEGVLKDFKPLTQIAQTLNIEDLQNISMKDIKTNFEFANGKVLVKPFTVKVKDMDMEIGGVHGLDQSLDYVINLKVPRSKLGDKGNQYVNGLVTQAANRGVPVAVNEIVNYHLNLGGTIKNPLLKVNLKETGASLAQDIKKQAADFAKAKADTVKTAVKDTLKAIKNDLAKTAKEELTKRILGGADTSVSAQPATDTKKRLETAGKGIINGFLKKKKSGTDSTGGR